MGMDRSRGWDIEFEMAMRSPGAPPLELVLPPPGGDLGGCGSHESDRRAVHEGAVLWEWFEILAAFAFDTSAISAASIAIRLLTIADPFT